VPYAKPGIALARAVLAAADEAGDAPEMVFLLGNHGLLTAAGDGDRARALIDEVEAVLRSGADLPDEPEDVDRTVLARPGTVDEDGARLLTGGVLTPDEAVFLGPRPFSRTPGEGTVELTADGGARVRADLSEDAREIARSMLQVAVHADPSAEVRYLDDDEVAALIDWEAEKWRRGMER
jgi:rhamnose utilization protein RhaD (predicted bifunctional aldolase and dehydrogenase)